MKVVTIVGARPQFIKAAVVSRAFAAKPEIEELILHTGQHYDVNMSDIFFSEMKIPKPNFRLEMGGKSHGAMTGQMLEKIEEVLLATKPDAVLVYGDTNTTLAGALAAVKLHIPVAHVEAGLRSFNRKMPEEINRILTDHVAQWLFCPSDVSVKNLRNEGIAATSIHTVGDVMYDAALFYKKQAKASAAVEKILSRNTPYYLATIHRAENTDDPSKIKNLVGALEKISKEVPVVWPLHPRTRKILEQSNIEAKSMILMEPVGYFDMIVLLDRCHAVFTDSGGVQKEAYFFKKKCVTLREETEWVETVDSGANVLVGSNPEDILNAHKNINARSANFNLPLFGDGHAGDKIADILLKRKSLQ